jgi:hypothetical protein
MEEHAVPVSGRDRVPGLTPEFVHAAYELAIRRAARDAHRSECRVDALECSICRAHAARIAEAKALLRRDPLS